jgi:hypothetical protein
MKRILTLCAAAMIAVAVPSVPAFAHPGGHGEEEQPTISRAAAEAKAKEVVKTMIGRNILEASWGPLAPASADLREGTTGGIEWVVVFKNPTAKDPAKRTLYVYLSNDGAYLAANHTGR